MKARERLKTAYMRFTGIVLFSLFLAGCALPRIIVLDDPLTPEEHINLGVAYENGGELDDALKEYEKAADSLPVAYLYMGNVFLKKNELEDAERYYRKAIKKEPRNADARNNLAWLYYLKGENLDEAESLASEAMELNPSKEEIYGDTLDRIRELKASRNAGCNDEPPAEN